MKRRRDIVTVFFLFLIASAAMWPTKPQSMQGIVENIQSNVIIVSAASGYPSSIAIAVNEKTQYRQITSLGGLKQGDRVKVEYKEEAGTNIATLIEKDKI